MVEFRPSKPAVRVRSPSPAPNKDYVVIIAKRIHLFPYRTQKLSSLAAMVLGGQPPGRVARSHVVCRSGGTGRRTGLKILRDLPLVPVRFRSSAPIKWTISSVG